jgi:GAF domain-containing protein
LYGEGRFPEAIQDRGNAVHYGPAGRHLTVFFAIMEKQLAPLDTLFPVDESPETALSQVVRWVGETLRADRCFLYIRNPTAGKGRIAFCWRKFASIPDVTQPEWQEDTGSLPQEDPLFAAALSDEPSVYVEDVETADPDVLNRVFENRTFGHRALIHAHITDKGQLWGILQPCQFGHPRRWTQYERSLMEDLLPQLLPWIQKYVSETSLQKNIPGQREG